MKSEEKRSLAEKVRRRFTKLVAPYGFVRAKTSFWVRPQLQTIDFIHLHLFAFQPAFRLHLGIRVLNDDFDAPSLNGPTTDEHREFYVGYSASILGAIIGTLWGFVDGYIAGAVIAWVYNRLAPGSTAAQ